ncbi:MAG: carboxypeptidase-like regulatory domain-containing protein [Candidatus Solibacter sp.]
MCKWLVLLAAAGAMHAAIIKGSVVENQTGKALARTLVTIQPLPGTQGPSGSVRTNTYGMFEFIELPAGGYVVHAARRGFMPAQYGQKNWRAAGQPIIVDKEQAVFLNVRLNRFSSISGMVVDENDVGLPQHEVIAMSNVRPPRMLQKAQADDRGVYRISGLDPGTYLVRTLGRPFEDGGYLPTFYRETARVEEAGTVDAVLDSETTNIKVRPLPGKLFTIGGRVYPARDAIATVTLVSDSGRETLTTGEAFQFHSKAPGPYEILVESPATRYTPPLGAYVAMSLEQRDITDMRINLLPMAGVSFGFKNTQGGRITDLSGIKIQYRRVDLAGEGPVETLKVTNGSAGLLPGRWQVMLVPSPAYVATDFQGPRGERPERGRADGWNEITVTGPTLVAFVLSSKPGSITGSVTMGANDSAPGVPVYLEAYDEVNRKRVVDLRTMRTDLRGKYSFDGLAPGTYRVVATFEYQAPLTSDIDAMRPKVITVEEGRELQLDLELWSIR